MEDKQVEKPKKVKEKYAGKEMLSLFVHIIKTTINVAILGLSFLAIVFMVSVAFPTNVQQAIEIFLNLFKNLQ